MTSKIDNVQKTLSATQIELSKCKDENQEIRNKFSTEAVQLKMQIKDLEDRLKSTTETDRRLSAPNACDTTDTVFFRGWWNPLSAFHKTRPFQYRGKLFHTAEHCYQYWKAIHHKNSLAARDIFRAKTPAMAKKIAKQSIPNPDSAWEAQNQSTMVDILKAKASQCASFRETLLKSDCKALVHNMESDSKWGMGVDGKGQNLMGKALMTVRTWIRQQPQPVPTLKPVVPLMSKPIPRPSMQKDTDMNILVIGNSNCRGLAHKLNKKGLNATGLVYRGCPSAGLQKGIEEFKFHKEPSHVFLHTGDIDARNGKPLADTTNTVLQVRRKFPRATILLNAPSACVDDYVVHRKMLQLRDTLGRMCQNVSGMRLVDSSRLRLWDDIHFTYTSQHILADRIAAQVSEDTQCF